MDNDYLFNFRINYNKLEGDYNSTGIVPLYNGNIAETIWKTDNVNKEKRSYGYMYDPLNRINKAGNRSGVNLDNIDDDFTFTLWNVNYDKNGNIETLRRSGKFTSQYYDNLIYNYEDNSNKLLGVIDISTCNCDEKGFNDTNNSNQDYTYDLNGNLLTDENKGITTPITYNHLNLPVEIAITNTLESGTISYVYDATGVKLEKTFTYSTGANNISITTQYAGNYVYSDNEIEGTMMLEFFNHPEGYVIPLPDNPDGTKNEKSVKSFTTDPGGGPGNITYSSYNYVFQYKDHLGNIRLSYADLDGDESINPNDEIIEENNFFPFGLKHWGYNNVVSSNGNSLAQQWKFGGKQLDQSLGLETYDFGARNYDPAIGRWMNVDPLADQMRRHSPYNYAFDNPIYFVDYDGMAPVDWIKNIDTGVVTWKDATGDAAIKLVAIDDSKMSPAENLKEPVKEKYKNLGTSFFGTKGENARDNAQIAAQQDEYLTNVSSDLNKKAGVDYKSDELGGFLGDNVTKTKLKSAFMGGNNGSTSANDSPLVSFVKGEVKNEIIETGLQKVFSISSKAASVSTALMTSTQMGQGSDRESNQKANANNAFQSKVMPLLDMGTIMNIMLHKY